MPFKSSKISKPELKEKITKNIKEINKLIANIFDDETKSLVATPTLENDINSLKSMLIETYGLATHPENGLNEREVTRDLLKLNKKVNDVSNAFELKKIKDMDLSTQKPPMFAEKQPYVPKLAADLIADKNIGSSSPKSTRNILAPNQKPNGNVQTTCNVPPPPQLATKEAKNTSTIKESTKSNIHFLRILTWPISNLPFLVRTGVKMVVAMVLISIPLYFTSLVYPALYTPLLTISMLYVYGWVGLHAIYKRIFPEGNNVIGTLSSKLKTATKMSINAVSNFSSRYLRVPPFLKTQLQKVKPSINKLVLHIPRPVKTFSKIVGTLTLVLISIPTLGIPLWLYLHHAKKNAQPNFQNKTRYEMEKTYASKVKIPNYQEPSRYRKAKKIIGLTALALISIPTLGIPYFTYKVLTYTPKQDFSSLTKKENEEIKRMVRKQ